MKKRCSPHTHTHTHTHTPLWKFCAEQGRNNDRDGSSCLSNRANDSDCLPTRPNRPGYGGSPSRPGCCFCPEYESRFLPFCAVWLVSPEGFFLARVRNVHVLRAPFHAEGTCPHTLFQRENGCVDLNGFLLAFFCVLVAVLLALVLSLVA